MRFVLLCLLALFTAHPGLARDYALEAPDEVGMRAGFDVHWMAPEAKGGLLEIRPAGGAARRAGYAYTTRNPQRMEAPEVPGDYVIVLVFDRQDRASQALRVVPVEAELDAPETVDAGARLDVIWEGPVNRNDHVTFAAADGAPMRGTSYAYVGNSRDGRVTLTAPQDAGAYDIVYVSGKTVLARHRIAVGAIEARLDVPGTVAAGARFDVDFSGPENAGDLVTFARRGGAPLKPASYAYVDHSEAGGTVSLRAFEETGPFDIVYLSGGRVIGRAEIEIVTPSMEISAPDEVPALLGFEARWRGVGNQGDRLLMVDPGSDEMRLFQYVDPQEPVLSMPAPREPGAFDLVYVTRGGKELARRPITVLPAPRAPGQLAVTAASGLGPDDAVEVILDASGSMLQRQDGARRIDVAKATLARLVNETIPQGTGFALRVFGNREADACRTDLELPLAPLDRDKATAVISSVNAVNLARTPIARSLALTAQDLADVAGERVLILLTDGEETCEGDPAGAIAALRAKGADVRVNIVGYAIDDEALADRFRSWAAAGGGRYFGARTGAELDDALLRAAATPFAILDEAGNTVGKGRAGDAPLTLPAGSYRLRMGGIDRDVQVVPDRVTQVNPE